MKYIEIFVYKKTKSGKVKKPQLELNIAFRDGDNESIAKTIKMNGYSGFASPYFFNHIQALNSKGEQVAIYESVEIGKDNRRIGTTPSTLYKLLTANHD